MAQAEKGKKSTVKKVLKDVADSQLTKDIVKIVVQSIARNVSKKNRLGKVDIKAIAGSAIEDVVRELISKATKKKVVKRVAKKAAKKKALKGK